MIITQEEYPAQWNDSSLVGQTLTSGERESDLQDYSLLYEVKQQCLYNMEMGKDLWNVRNDKL